jgi:hypothetical protein
MIVFAGGEMPSFLPSVPANGEYVGDYDGTRARCNVRAIGDLIAFPWNKGFFLQPLTTCWSHMEHNVSIGEGVDGTWRPVIIWSDSGGVDRIQVEVLETISAIRIMYNTGAGFINQAGGNYPVAYINRQQYDFQFIVNSGAGRIRLYNGGTKQIESNAIDLSAIPDINCVRFQGTRSGFTGIGSLCSQVVCADEPTIGWKMTTYVPSGAGPATDWTGLFSDINELVYNDGNFISTPTNNAVSNYAMTPVSALDGSEIKAVVVTARARTNGGGPTHLEMSVNSTGTNHFSPSILQDVGFNPNIAVWETNPETGIKWVDADLGNFKPGVKALA